MPNSAGVNVASSFVDPVTGRRIRQLTSGADPAVHAYFDIPPWSSTTGWLVFSRRTVGTDEGDVCVVDSDGSCFTVVGRSRAMVPNCGAMPQWSGDGRRVYFCDRDGDRQTVCSVDPDRGTTETFPGSLRMMRPSDNEYAYHSEHRYYTADDYAPERRSEQGVFVRNLDNGTTRRLATVAECLDLHPRRDQVTCLPLRVKHTKWSPSGERLMFVLTSGKVANRRPEVHDMYVVKADGSGLRRVGTIVNHPSWHPDGGHILCNGVLGDDPEKKLVLLDVETGERRLVTDRVPGMGHPSYSPDGQWIVLDDVPARSGPASIKVVHPESGEQRVLVVTTVTDHSHDGTHLHPVWSRDGNQILYASDATGVAQLYVVDFT